MAGSIGTLLSLPREVTVWPAQAGRPSGVSGRHWSKPRPRPHYTWRLRPNVSSFNYSYRQRNMSAIFSSKKSPWKYRSKAIQFRPLFLLRNENKNKSEIVNIGSIVSEIEIVTMPHPLGDSLATRVSQGSCIQTQVTRLSRRRSYSSLLIK